MNRPHLSGDKPLSDCGRVFLVGTERIDHGHERVHGGNDVGHELAHIWAGQSAVSEGQPRQLDGQGAELWCNAVAAELLVPMHWPERPPIEPVYRALARLPRAPLFTSTSWGPRSGES